MIAKITKQFQLFGDFLFTHLFIYLKNLKKYKKVLQFQDSYDIIFQLKVCHALSYKFTRIRNVTKRCRVAIKYDYLRKAVN